MTNKLTDAQIALMHSGLRRADRCIVLPIGKGGSARKLATRMIDAGWLKEIRAKWEAPIWRSDKATGSNFSLKLTAAAFKVIDAKPDRGVETNPIAEGHGDHKTDDRLGTSEFQPNVQGARFVQPSFREGSKFAKAVKLLKSDSGATIEQLSAVMSWLLHSTRSMLTGLRKRGIVITRRKTLNRGAIAYSIEMAGLVDAHGEG